jgi:hypothetical protein
VFRYHTIRTVSPHCLVAIVNPSSHSGCGA